MQVSRISGHTAAPFTPQVVYTVLLAAVHTQVTKALLVSNHPTLPYCTTTPSPHTAKRLLGRIATCLTPGERCTPARRTTARAHSLTRRQTDTWLTKQPDNALPPPSFLNHASPRFLPDVDADSTADSTTAYVSL
ncbi:hypothetical protein E2C01_034561 [Portunus trituberculatus]|uniref:Uncharacterized protein n=1 Tax=Portunus trituberculatus TaxID=210409 RepID=A0A5B7F356_PORTR|nr:hypothetical protein [Portunus trituberculatus]